MQSPISHSGIVVSIKNRNSAVVRIEQLSACAECHAAGICNASDKKEKLIDAVIPEDCKISLGEQVLVESKEDNRAAAIILAYILPLLVMVAVLFLSITTFGLPEAAGALFSIVFLVVDFVILWFLRDKLKKRFVFYVQKIQS